MINNELQPCPLCGEPVFSRDEKSKDGTVTWVTIMHGPTTPCGISFTAGEEDAVEKWNRRSYTAYIDEFIPSAI